jgi:hypothetical protein
VDAANNTVTVSSNTGTTGSVTLAAGEQVTCTFTNSKLAQLIVAKVITGGGAQLFDFTRNPGNVSFQLTDGGSNNSGFSLSPGTYTVCESNIPAGWSVSVTVDGTAVTPVNPNSPQDLGTRCVDVPLTYGDSKTVVWTNTPPPGGSARTIGYWKNWSSCTTGGQYERAVANGEVGQTLDGNLPQQIGNLAVNTCPIGVAILDKRDVVSGLKRASDAAYGLAAQLLAAKLNVSAGAATCSKATTAINAGQALLVKIGFVGTGSYLRPLNGTDYTSANSLAATLDAYNNNTLCP